VISVHRSRDLVLSLVATSAVVLALLPGPARGSVSVDPAGAAPVRIALLGDSITQGSAGDWTWRYRLWKHLVASGVDVDLTGDRDDLNPAGTSSYVDPAFDRDHDARWGDAYLWLTHPVPELMSAQHPDVLVVLLGTNDLTFFGQTPQQVLDRTHAALDQARAANPSVKVVLCHLTATWIAGVDQFNDLLDAAAPGWSTSQSPVAVADTDAGFVTSSQTVLGDTWDTVHPDARGEVKIAAAVSDALARLGIGTAYPRPLPAVPLGPRSAATVAATPGDGVADLTWTDPPGADSERVWLRDVTAGAAAEMVSQATGSATRLTGLRNGHTYEVTLQPVKGFVPAEADVRSVAVRVTPSQAVPAAPGGVVGQTASHGARLSWRADPLATSYTVWWRNLSARTGWQTLTTTSTTAWLSGLEAGARHELRVAGVNSSGASGELSPSVLVTPTGPRPTAPRSLRARTSRGGLATLRWTRSTSTT
jgi:lysophospholipase L1-like esterase